MHEQTPININIEEVDKHKKLNTVFIHTVIIGKVNRRKNARTRSTNG